eukprot:c4952_g1_i2.p1 GENE.c4952_g1_i2~~c4952_g1_i2.p1  ORF type:complete len:806 (+),score=139.01 c4952_g1_i2:73-2490(+)
MQNKPRSASLIKPIRVTPRGGPETRQAQDSLSESSTTDMPNGTIRSRVGGSRLVPKPGVQPGPKSPKLASRTLGNGTPRGPNVVTRPLTSVKQVSNPRVVTPRVVGGSRTNDDIDYHRRATDATRYPLNQSSSGNLEYEDEGSSPEVQHHSMGDHNNHHVPSRVKPRFDEDDEEHPGQNGRSGPPVIAPIKGIPALRTGIVKPVDQGAAASARTRDAALNPRPQRSVSLTAQQYVNRNRVPGGEARPPPSQVPLSQGLSNAAKSRIALTPREKALPASPRPQTISTPRDDMGQRRVTKVASTTQVRKPPGVGVGVGVQPIHHFSPIRTNSKDVVAKLKPLKTEPSPSPVVSQPRLVGKQIGPARRVKNVISEKRQSRRPSLSAPSKDELKKINALKRVAHKERKLQMKKDEEERDGKSKPDDGTSPVSNSSQSTDALPGSPRSSQSKLPSKPPSQSSVTKIQVSVVRGSPMPEPPERPPPPPRPVDPRFKNLSLDDLDDMGTLGRGCFGRVKLVRHRATQQLFALKILNKRHQIEQQQVQHAMNENNILQRIDHPFIVKHYGSFQDSNNLYILMERVVGTEFYDLLQEVRHFDEDQTRFFSAQIVLILEHLHRVHKVVYRDLKPENILLDHEGYLKLTDFGFAKIEPGTTFTFCGTPCYIAPEVIYQAGYTRAVDWWSFGVMVYEMLKGEPPLDNDDLLQLYDDILNTEPQFDSTFSPEARDLICRLLIKDPERRFGICGRGVADVKVHPFFKGIDWEALSQKQIVSPFGGIDALKQGLDPYFDEEEEPELEPLTTEEQDRFRNF